MDGISWKAIAKCLRLITGTKQWGGAKIHNALHQQKEFWHNGGR
jgi:hypothetical protein